MEIPNVEKFLQALPHLRGLQVEAVVLAEGGVTVRLTAAHPRAPCPRCHQPSRHVHSRYGRAVTDLPWSGLCVTLRVLRLLTSPAEHRGCRCRNRAWPGRVFCERLPALVPVPGRRTHRGRAVLATVGAALGGRPGA